MHHQQMASRAARGRRDAGVGAGVGGASAALAAAAMQDELVRRMRGPLPPRRRKPAATAGGSTAGVRERQRLERPESPPPPELTLAQRIGLVAAPPPRLTAAEWQCVHMASRGRGDTLAQCPICRGDFGTDAQRQVLLSCSHVFHRTCLASYERFSGQRCCPMCRVVHYYKLAIDDSQAEHYSKCVVRAQAVARGFLARRRAAALREVTAPLDPRRKRAWAADKVTRAATKLADAVDESINDVDDLMRQLDASLRRSRRTMGELDTSAIDRRLNQRLEQRAAMAEGLDKFLAGSRSRRADSATLDAGCDGQELLPARPRESQREGAEDQRLAELVREERSLADGLSIEAAAREELSAEARKAMSADPMDANGVNWDAVIATSLERGGAEGECPICLQALTRRTGNGGEEGSAGAGDGTSVPGKGRGGIAWLSCTHIFHADCLLAFEEFGAARAEGVRCPCCRCPYKRLHLPAD